MHMWKDKGACLRLKSDSTSALILVLHMKTRGKATGIIARELALTLAKANFYPSVAEHIPGLANQVADMLSRRFQPGKAFQLPAILEKIEETSLEARGAEFYPTLTRPPEAIVAELGAQERVDMLKNKLRLKRQRG